MLSTNETLIDIIFVQTLTKNLNKIQEKIARSEHRANSCLQFICEGNQQTFLQLDEELLNLTQRGDEKEQ